MTSQLRYDSCNRFISRRLTLFRLGLFEGGSAWGGGGWGGGKVPAACNSRTINDSEMKFGGVVKDH